jgi:hypothetical protein
LQEAFDFFAGITRTRKHFGLIIRKLNIFHKLWQN